MAWQKIRRDGMNAARRGEPVTSNPWPYGPRRTAWDGGWRHCAPVGDVDAEIETLTLQQHAITQRLRTLRYLKERSK